MYREWKISGKTQLRARVAYKLSPWEFVWKGALFFMVWKAVFSAI